MTPTEAFKEIETCKCPQRWQELAAVIIGPSVHTLRDDRGLAAFLQPYADRTFVMSTRPDVRRTGLATMLLFVAGPLDYAETTYTPAGAATVQAFLSTKGIGAAPCSMCR